MKDMFGGTRSSTDTEQTDSDMNVRAAIRAVQYDQIDFLGRDDQARDSLKSTAVSCQE
jgi:hypothetical protein